MGVLVSPYEIETGEGEAPSKPNGFSCSVPVGTSHSPSAPLRTFGARTPLLRSVVPPMAIGDWPKGRSSSTSGAESPTVHCIGLLIDYSNSHWFAQDLYDNTAPGPHAPAQKRISRPFSDNIQPVLPCNLDKRLPNVPDLLLGQPEGVELPDFRGAGDDAGDPALL